MNFDLKTPELYINRVFRRTCGIYKDDLFRLTHNDDEGYTLTDIYNSVDVWSNDGIRPFGSFYPSCEYWELMPDSGSGSIKGDSRELI